MAVWKFAATVVTKVGAYAVYSPAGFGDNDLEHLRNAIEHMGDEFKPMLFARDFRLVAVSDRPEALPDELEESVLDAYAVGNGGGPVQVEERLGNYHVRFAATTMEELLSLKARYQTKKGGA